MKAFFTILTLTISCCLAHGQILLEVEGDVLVSGNVVVASPVKSDSFPVKDQDFVTKEYLDNVILLLGIASGFNGIQKLLDKGYSPLDLINAGADTSQFYGARYGGGLIYELYMDGTGYTITEHSIDTTDWGCASTLVSGADGDQLRDGPQNTIDIITACSFQNGYAAKLCDELIIDGFDDWFLPSVGMFEQFVVQNAPPLRNKLLTNNNFWTSTESGETTAQSVNMNNYSLVRTEFEPKSTLNDVRAVRAF